MRTMSQEELLAISQSQKILAELFIEQKKRRKLEKGRAEKERVRLKKLSEMQEQ